MSEIKISEMVETVKSWGRVIKTAVLAVGVLMSSYLVPKYTMEHKEASAAGNEQQQATPASSQASTGVAPVAMPVMSPPPASSAPAALPSVTFTVLSTGQSRSGKKFLNSTTNYRDPGNQVVVLEGGAAASIDVNSLKGRTITAFGKQSSYKGQPQIVVTEASGIQVR